MLQMINLMPKEVNHKLCREFSFRGDTGFPCGLADKDSICNVGDLGSIPELGRSPGEGKGYPSHYSVLREFHGLYSQRGHKESDMTE